MSGDALVDGIRGAVASLLEVGVDDIDPSDDLEATWGFDSLLFLELIDHIEVLVDRRLDEELFDGARSVVDLARAVGVSCA